jgi:signal transduction histidine kinase
MGERAATISAASAGRRLPVPAGDDEIARLGTRLNDMLGRLEAGLERERTFVANASHELRTPLALMKTEIELALADPSSGPALAAALRSTGEETDRLSQLTDDLLLLARADAGELPVRRSEVAVQELLDTIATRFRRRADENGRSIAVRSEDVALLGDRRLLEQALSNLVENALRHGAGTVTLQAARTNGVVTIHVGDEGTGLPPEFVGRAFERFSRDERSRTSAGAGLGLAIVATIAHAHGGAAGVSSAAAGVTLTLPSVVR